MIIFFNEILHKYISISKICFHCESYISYIICNKIVYFLSSQDDSLAIWRKNVVSRRIYQTIPDSKAYPTRKDGCGPDHLLPL